MTAFIVTFDSDDDEGFEILEDEILEDEEDDELAETEEEDVIWETTEE